MICGIVPSSGQPESLFTSDGKKATLTKMNTAPIGAANRRQSKPPSHGASSTGHAQKAIRNGTKRSMTPSSEHSRRLSPKSQWSFSPHHWQGKVPRRTLICLPQHGHLSIFRAPDPYSTPGMQQSLTGDPALLLCQHGGIVPRARTGPLNRQRMVGEEPGVMGVAFQDACAGPWGAPCWALGHGHPRLAGRPSPVSERAPFPRWA